MALNPRTTHAILPLLLLTIFLAFTHFRTKRILSLQTSSLSMANTSHSESKQGEINTLVDNKWEIEQLPIMTSVSRGFRPVYVYSKAVPEVRSNYAQVKQDRIILSLVAANNAKVTNTNEMEHTEQVKRKRMGEDEDPGGKHPFFVDLASNDALKLSNTFLLEANGWNGLCIEPNPRYWYRLASFRTCTIVGAFVGGTVDGVEVDVQLSNGKFGGIAGQGMDNKESKKEEKRNLVSILTIFKETNVPREIDYFSLDVEGAESLVMENFPWSSYTFKFMTIERPKDDLIQKLASAGYIMVKRLSNWGETLWINEVSVHLSQEEIDSVIMSI